MRVDAYAHALPERFKSAVRQEHGASFPRELSEMWDSVPALTDMNERINIMDEHEVDMQVLVPSIPPMEDLFQHPATSSRMARIANEGMAEVVARYPGRFVGVGTVSILEPAAAADEVVRCVEELGLRGVLLWANPNQRPLDAPELEGIFRAVERLDVPIWIHPCRLQSQADYKSEHESKFIAWYCFGWPYDTTLAATRLVFGGVFDRHPGLKVILHHAGAMIPFFAKRIEHLYQPEWALHFGVDIRNAPPALSLFRKFYVDTVTFGSASALRNAYDFFGAERMVFGTDMPFDPKGGRIFLREAIEALDALSAPARDKNMLWGENILGLCRLSAPV